MTRPWTQEELDIVRKEYPTTSSSKLAAKLNRTSTSIRTRAHMMGVFSNYKSNGALVRCKRKPVGARIVDYNGYIMVKVSEGRSKADWQPLHRLMWIEAHGPIPETHVVLFIKGMRQSFNENPSVDKLQLVEKSKITSLIAPDEESKKIVSEKRRETMKKKRQGLVLMEAPSKEELYYIQDSRSYVGNSMLFWRDGGSGYTTNLEEAGLYSKQHAFSQHRCRSSDLPWPESYIRARAKSHVDMQSIDVNHEFKKIKESA